MAELEEREERQGGQGGHGDTGTRGHGDTGNIFDRFSASPTLPCHRVSSKSPIPNPQ
jgi:hypothetical protein